MAGVAEKKKESKKSRTGEGLMLSQKWENHKKKKETAEQKEMKKKKDTERYLLKKEEKKTMCKHEKRELKLLQHILKK